MSERDYIPPAERPVRIEGQDDVSGYTHLALDRSHAVADSVMLAMADELRDWLPCSCIWCEEPEYRGPCANAEATVAVLARYDALIGAGDE